MVNTREYRVGRVVFLSMSRVATPPTVSMDRLRGVTSRRSRLLSVPAATRLFPSRVLPRMAAPFATHSSGLMFLEGSFPVSIRTFSWTAGILVEPPTTDASFHTLLS